MKIEIVVVQKRPIRAFTHQLAFEQSLELALLYRPSNAKFAAKGAACGARGSHL